MSHKTPTVAGKQLSSSLKERLKRCGRYHSSPQGSTPEARQLGTSQLSRQLPLHKQEPFMSGTPTKKLRLDHSADARKCLNISDRHLSPQNTSPDIRNTEGVCESETRKNIAKTVTPLSELQRNQDFSRNQSLAVGVLEPLLAKCDCSATASQPVGSRKETACAILDEKSNKVCSVKRDLISNHNLKSEVLAEVSNPVITSKMNSLTTPVRSRSLIRTDPVRGSKLNFDKQSERTQPLQDLGTGSGNETSVHDSLVQQEDTVARFGKAETVEDSFRDKQKLLKEIAEKEEVLRKLKMVKMYRTKNNLSDLEKLIEKWRGVTQSGLQDLHESLPEPKPSLTELLQHLGVDHNLVKFDPVEESFDS